MNTQLPALIIPAYQPESKLIDLVDTLLQQPYPKIVVVNDGSSPDKKAIFHTLEKKDRVVVLHHAVNLGKGAALKTAFNAVLIGGFSHSGVVTLDADGQHLPADVLRVAEKTQVSANALVLGAREFKGTIPLRSQFGNVLTKYIFHFLIGKKLLDTQTGLRGIPLPFLRMLIPLPAMRYEFELDMLILAARNGLHVVEVPIATVYENNNQGSHFNPLLDSFRIYFVFFRFIFSSLLTFVTDIFFFSFVYHFIRNILVAFLIGRTIALGVNLVSSKFFVFKSKNDLRLELIKFVALWLVLLVLSYSLTILLVDRLHFNVYFSRISVDSALFIFNFLVQRDFIFFGGAKREVPSVE